MPRHHSHVGTPVLKTYQHAHAYFVHACLPHAVEAVDAPLEVGLLPGRVIYIVPLAVICLLEAHHAVETRECEAPVVFGRKRHHLYAEVVEVRAAHLKRLLQILGAGGHGVLARYEQQVLEGAEAAYGLALVGNLWRREDDAPESVVAVEAAVHAGVGARIGDIQRYIHRNHLAEAFLCEGAAASRHSLEVRRCRRRYESHEVVDAGAFFAEGALHVGGSLGGYCGGGGVPVVLFKFFRKHCQSRKDVSGLLACALRHTPPSPAS